MNYILIVLWPSKILIFQVISSYLIPEYKLIFSGVLINHKLTCSFCQFWYNISHDDSLEIHNSTRKKQLFPLVGYRISFCREDHAMLPRLTSDLQSSCLTVECYAYASAAGQKFPETCILFPSCRLSQCQWSSLSPTHLLTPAPSHTHLTCHSAPRLTSPRRVAQLSLYSST